MAESGSQFTVYPHKVHGWMMLPHLPATLAAVDEVTQWIAERLAARMQGDHVADPSR